MESPIKNAEDLVKQDSVKYGCLRKGATADFFKVRIQIISLNGGRVGVNIVLTYFNLYLLC